MWGRIFSLPMCRAKSPRSSMFSGLATGTADEDFAAGFAQAHGQGFERVQARGINGRSCCAHA